MSPNWGNHSKSSYNIGMNHEQPPHGSEQPKISRRKFLTAAATAVGAATLGYVEREKLGFGTLPEVREAFTNAKEAQKSQYEATGELPELETQRRLELLHELTAYMERGGERTTEGDFDKKFSAFSAAVLQNSATREITLPGAVPQSPALKKMVALKLAFHEQAGTTYNEEHHTAADPVLERRTQCRSGTVALLMLAMEAAKQPDHVGGETLVMIHTHGHVQPGLLTRDGTLVALEMTSAGQGVRDFGQMKDIKKPIRVVRADHALYQEALDTEAHREKAILFATVEDVLPPGEWQRAGKFGFGVAQVPKGDRPMAHADMLPADDVFDGERVYDRMERLESEEEILQLIRDPKEQQFVREYMVHLRTIRKYYNEYVGIFNTVENMSQANRGRRIPEPDFKAAEEAMSRLVEAVESYAAANQLEGPYDRSQAILARYGKEILQRSPKGIVAAMRNNLAVLRRNH